MEAIVAAKDQLLANKIRDSLVRLAVSSTNPQVLSYELALAAITGRQTKSTLLVFFASQSFPAEDISVLKHFTLAAPDRCKVVAVGAGHNPNIILQLMRGGAVDYLDGNNNLDGELNCLIERFNATQLESGQQAKLFTVISPVGGAGSSLIALNVATALAQKGERCRLLDLHLRGGDLARLSKSTPRYTLASLASKAQNLDMAMFEQSLSQHESGIQLLSSPEPFGDYKQFSQQIIQKVVQYARTNCSYVIVDLEDAEHPEQVRLLAASDKIIIPLRPELVSLYRTFKFLEYLSQANVPHDHITLVANRSGQPKCLATQRMAKVLEMPIEHDIPEDPAAVNTSFNLGIPLVVCAPHAKSSLSIVRLADALRGVHEQAAVGVRSTRWSAGLTALKSLRDRFVDRSARLPQQLEQPAT